MPRKKAAVADPSVPTNILPGVLAPIACPACKSKISSDGKTLHEKSSYLDELVETDAGVDEIEKSISARNAERAALEKKVSERDATIADLRAQLEAKSKPAAPAPQKETANVGQQGQKGKSWWD